MKELEEILQGAYGDPYYNCYRHILDVWHITKHRFLFYGSLLNRARLSCGGDRPPPFNEFVRAYNREAKAHGGRMMRYV